MPTPQFIGWVSEKLEQHGHQKVIPTKAELASLFEHSLADTVHRALTEKILAEQDVHRQVAEELRRLERLRTATVAKLPVQVIDHLSSSPKDWWQVPVIDQALCMARNAGHLV
jgi:hypothetical protein